MLAGVIAGIGRTLSPQARVPLQTDLHIALALAPDLDSARPWRGRRSSCGPAGRPRARRTPAEVAALVQFGARFLWRPPAEGGRAEERGRSARVRGTRPGSASSSGSGGAARAAALAAGPSRRTSTTADPQVRGRLTAPRGGELPHRRRGGPSILGNKLGEAVDLLRAGPAAHGLSPRPGDRWMLPEVRRILRERYGVAYRGWLRAWCDRHGVTTSLVHYT